jgi:hypothetical protein
MTEAKELTIKLDDSFTGSVCDYSVGFLKFKREGKTEVAEPAGTGTFVKLGRVYGSYDWAGAFSKRSTAAPEPAD